MSVPVTASTFIRNNISGAFCLFESMASLLPFVGDMIIIDLGSNDGTLDYLKRIARANPRIRLMASKFSRIDASAFADAANACVANATHPNVLFWQADEIWHQDLLLRMEKAFEEEIFDLNFWRVQLKYNFQRIKWFPHPVHRVGPKDNFHFYDDGMNTERRWGVDVCSEYNMGQFAKWSDEYSLAPHTLPLHEMILDVSQTGAFLDNIVAKRRLHSPFWHENDVLEGMDAMAWLNEQRSNQDWSSRATPFNIPHIMERHLGRKRYVPDDDLIQALMEDDTKKLLGYG